MCVCVFARQGGAVFTFILLAAFAIPSQQNRVPKIDPPIAPEQVLGWQLGGLTQEEIQAEVHARGLTEYPEIALLSALSASGADEETVRTLRKSKAPRKIWKLGLRLPGPTDYLYQIAGAILWNDRDAALIAIQNEAEKQPRNPDDHLIYANLAKTEGDGMPTRSRPRR